MRFQHKRRIVSIALAILCSIGFTDHLCAQFPSNPFAGKLPSLPVPKLFGGKLQAPRVKPLANKLSVPKLPGLPSLPRPNFGNLKRTIQTPAAQAIATRTNQPPAAPSQIFDTSSADRQIAAGKMPSDVKSSLDRARKAAEASRDALNTSQNDFNSAVAGTKPPKSENLFSKIKTKPSQSTASAAQHSGSSSRSGNLWGNYKPDLGPSSSNRSSGGIEDLAKVNPRLYDRYGKLTSSNGADGQFVATNAERDFDFQPEKASRAATDKVSSDNAEATIAGLRSQLMELRSRGAGTSDQLKMPHRSAFEIAGIAPVKPVVEEPELPVHRGFGNAASFGDRQQTVSIPDPTAPTNVLRAAARPTPGMVATHEIKSDFNKTASNTLAADLPVGNKLSNNSASESMVNNDFVGLANTDSTVDAKKDPIPKLRAAATEQVPSMELPRQLSQASLDALEQAKQEKLNQPLPEINQNSGPLVGGFQNPKVASTQFQPQTTTPPAPKSQQRSSAFPGNFQSQVPARQQQVTSNQFFSRAAKEAPVKTVAEPTARVAEAQLLPPALPEGITTGDGTYSPGSVRSLEKKLW